MPGTDEDFRIAYGELFSYAWLLLMLTVDRGTSPFAGAVVGHPRRKHNQKKIPTLQKNAKPLYSLTSPPRSGFVQQTRCRQGRVSIFVSCCMRLARPG